MAFCILVQLALEKADKSESLELIELFKKLGLPVNLKQMGLENIDDEKLKIVAKASLKKGETMHNMPFKPTIDMVITAILEADKLGSL